MLPLIFKKVYLLPLTNILTSLGIGDGVSNGLLVGVGKCGSLIAEEYIHNANAMAAMTTVIAAIIQ